MKSNFSLYPFLWILLPFAFGVFLETYIGLGILFWLIAVSVLLLASVYSWFKRGFLLHLFLILGFICAGAFYLCVEQESIAENRVRRLYDEGRLNSGDPVEVFGTLIRQELTPGGIFFIIQTEHLVFRGKKQQVSGKIRVFLPFYSQEMIEDYERLSIEPGSGIAIFCSLKREDEFKNTGVISTKLILDRKEIDAGCSLKSPLLIEKREELNVWNPFSVLLDLREFLINETLRIFSAKTAGVIIASLLGNPYFLDKETSRAFLEGGTYHLLVVSGLQVTFIALVFMMILSFFTRNRFLLLLLVGFFVWVYALSVGSYEKPVIRAAFMLTVVLLGKLFFRQPAMLNLVALSAFVLILLKPSDLFDPSFQLTFLCVFAISGTAFPLIEKFRQIGEWRLSEENPIPPFCSESLKAFCETLYWSERRWQYEMSQNVWSCRLFKNSLAEKLESLGIQKGLRLLFEAFVVTVSVQFWLLPLMAVYFNRISIAGILLNFWVGFLMSVESLTAMASVILSQINHHVAFSFVLITEFLNALILSTTKLFVIEDFSVFRVANYSGMMKIIYLMYFIPVIFFSFLINRWNPFCYLGSSFRKGLALSLFALVTFSFFVILHPFSRPSPDGFLHVEFLDVGQGDSIFIKMPSGETFLVDGGGKESRFYVESSNGNETEVFEPETKRIGEIVVSSFLWKKGYSEVDFILGTHADSDHIQGLSDVAKNFRIKMAFFGGVYSDEESFAELRRILMKKGVKIETLKKGDELRFGDVVFKVLNPKTEENDLDNNDSVVLRVCYHEVCFLLTGDIEQETEEALLEDDLRAEVVKVAHHGSKTSSTEYFIKATRAKFAVISAPKNSPFGHPDESVVERWKKAGAFVLTTGENGTISFATDGKRIYLKTFSEPTVFR